MTAVRRDDGLLVDQTKFRVRIIKEPPIADEHNITVGREFDARWEPESGGIPACDPFGDAKTTPNIRGENKMVWVMGDAGEECKLYSTEYELVTP